MFLGGLSPAIGMRDGGDSGGYRFRTGESGTKPAGGKGNNIGFGEKYIGI
jgi:hypothetical protein